MKSERAVLTCWFLWNMKMIKTDIVSLYYGPACTWHLVEGTLNSNRWFINSVFCQYLKHTWAFLESLKAGFQSPYINKLLTGDQSKCQGGALS